MPLSYFLLTSAALFSIGLACMLTRRHILLMLMGLELMLNAVNINLVAFSRNDPSLQGQVFSLFVLVVAAAETVIALALMVQSYRYVRSVRPSDLDLLKK